MISFRLLTILHAIAIHKALAQTAVVNVTHLLIPFPLTGVYYGVIVRMHMPAIVQYALGGMFIMALGLGYGISVAVRCIVWLVVPTLCGRNGRAYVGAFALAFVIAGRQP